MADKKYVSLTSLSQFLTKLNAKFALKSHSHSAATTSASGFMSSTDKKNLTNAMNDITTLKKSKTLAQTVTLDATKWASTTTDILPYKYVYSNTSILENDIFDVYFDDKSVLEVNKCYIIVKGNSGAGNITFLAKKKPSVNLTIGEIRYVR